MGLKITVYQVWSKTLAPEEREPVLHFTCTQWNAPATEEGAVQLKDKVSEEFYRQNEATRKRNQKVSKNKRRPELNVHIWIKEVRAEVEDQHLVIQ